MRRELAIYTILSLDNVYGDNGLTIRRFVRRPSGEGALETL